LQVKVASLRINRLISDGGLPQDQRLTWTTRNSHQPQDQFVPPVSLGAVSLLKAETIAKD
jgi:hypothetical protein